MGENAASQQAMSVTSGRCAVLSFAAFVLAGLSVTPLVPADLAGKLILAGVWILVGVRWASQCYEIRQAARGRDVPEPC